VSKLSSLTQDQWSYELSRPKTMCLWISCEVVALWFSLYEWLSQLLTMMPQKLSSGLLVLATVHLPLSVYAPLSYSEVRAVRSPWAIVRHGRCSPPRGYRMAAAGPVAMCSLLCLVSSCRHLVRACLRAMRIDMDDRKNRRTAWRYTRQHGDPGLDGGVRLQVTL
jgi:hypothetical protein